MKQRLLSLDVLRGLTVFCMILVNNGYGPTFEPLGHSAWNGMTPCDLVFPFFLFMVGVSIYISLSRHAGEEGMVKKILKRTLIMFTLGVALHAWDMIIWGNAQGIASHLRIWGVLQRIALSYCGAALFFNATRGKYLWHTIIGLLVIYAIILIVGNGYSTDPNENWLARVDRSLFGNHLYQKALDGRSPLDPEGLVGVIAGIAHALLGVACGRAIMTGRDNTEKVMKVLVISASIGIIGYLLSYGFPLNKRIWSPSYTLVTCSMAAGLLGLFTCVIDMQGHNRWCRLFQMFGMNALGIYTLSEMLPSVIGQLGISEGIYACWSGLFGPNEWASLCYALTIDGIMALVAWFLFKKKIYIKI